MKLRTIITAFALPAVLIGCTSEAYESGDGYYSGMVAEFSEALTDGTGAFVSIETDGGESLSLTQAYKSEWGGVADTAYRALVYYERELSSTGTAAARLMGLQSVVVPSVQPASEFKEGVKTDPVSFQSAWISASGRYLNLDFSVKTGTLSDTDVIQLVGMSLDSVCQDSTGRRTFSLRLYHDQGNAPEYYSKQCYLSVPLFRGHAAATAGDTVQISIQTYDGMVSKRFIAK